MALAAYRSIIRSARLAFQGDTETLTAALAQTRKGFQENKGVDAALASDLVRDAQEIATVLRANVVQGQKTESGNYKLRIHEETERGDNESIKKAKEAMPNGTKCCSS